MAENIDNEILISLVQIRPVLWDKTLEMYKDRNATRNAWKDVCCELNKDFKDMKDKTKNEFGKAVIRRWTNLRDAFSKSKKKQQDCKKSGSGAPNVKKYVYNDQMQFLNKLYDSKETVDGLENTYNSDDGFVDNEQLQPASGMEEDVAHHNQVTSQEKNIGRFGNRKRRKPDEIELKMLKALEPEKPDSFMSFFQGVMPHLSKFDDSEVLEFQMGVLQVISKINEKKNPTQSPTFPYHPQQFSAPQPSSFPYHPQQFSAPQPPSFPYHPQPPSFPYPRAPALLLPSCSSYFNPPPTYQTSFSQQPQLFNSQNNPFPNPANQKNYTLRREPVSHQSPAATSPNTYPTDSPSPALSGSSENTFDFNTLN